MDPTRFDDLARAWGRPASRRRTLGVLLGGALAARGLRAESAKGGNRACAHFCPAVFPPGAARDQCLSDAALGRGGGSQCGPAASATGLTLCGRAGVDEQTDNTNCGGGRCVVACNKGYQPDDADGCQPATPNVCSGKVSANPCYPRDAAPLQRERNLPVRHRP